MLRPPETAVAVEHLDIAVAQVPEPPARLLGERLVPFDRVDMADHPGQHGRRIPRAGADLEHAILWSRLDGGDHEGNDVGLGNRLTFLDRQRGVLVGELRQAIGQEHLPRDHPHAVEYLLVLHASGGDLVPHHVLAQDAHVRHEILPRPAQYNSTAARRDT
jgi:hypothetical protein